MTRYEMFSLIISVVGITAITLTLIVYSLHLRQMIKQSKVLADSMKDNSWQNFQSRMTTLNSLLVAKPHLRPYFYSGKRIQKSHKQYQQALAMAQLYLDVFDHLLANRRHMPDAWEWSGQMWERWIKDMFDTGPLLRELIREEKMWYPEYLLNLAGIEYEINK